MKSIKYSPRSYFFTEPDKLEVIDNSTVERQVADSFGPVISESGVSTQYRLTSWVRATDAAEKIKVFAITRGRVLVVPCGNNKINIIQRVEKDIDASLPLRYIIYRGLITADFIDGDNVAVQTENSCTLLCKMWAAFHGINGNESDFPAGQIGYTFDFDGNTLIDEYFKEYPHSSTEASYQLPMVRGGEWIGCFTERIGIDLVLDNGNAVSDIETDLFPINMQYATSECGILDEEDVKQEGVSTEEQDYLLHRYKDNVQRFMDVAAFYGSHVECGYIQVMYAEGYRPVSDVTQIYNQVLNKFQTRHKTYLYIRENYGLSYGFHDPGDDKRKLYFGHSSEQSGPKPSPDEAYTTLGWNIYIRDIPTDRNTPVKYDCIVSSYIDSEIEEIYRQASIDVVATNAEGIYPVVYKADKTERTDLPSVTVSLHPYLQTTDNGYLCSSFIMLHGMLTIRSASEAAGKATLPDIDYNYSCLWRADVKNPVENKTSQISIVSSKSSCMPGVPSMRQRIVFEKYGDLGLRLYASVGQNDSDLEGNVTSPLEEKILNIDSNFTNKDYFRAVFGNACFSIYKGDVVESESNSSLTTLSIVNSNCITERNRWYLLGITEEEYNQCVEDLKDKTYCSKIYFALNELLDDSTVDSFYHKYELRIQYDTPQSINNILPISENKKVYIFTVDRHVFFSEKYADNIMYKLDSSMISYATFSTLQKELAAEYNVACYDGSFGYDWFRGDLYTTEQKYKFKNIIVGGCRYGNEKELGSDAIKSYKLLRHEYEFFPIDLSEPYYIPYLRLFAESVTNDTGSGIPCPSTCHLLFNIANTVPSEYCFYFDEFFFRVTAILKQNEGISRKNITKDSKMSESSFVIEIECIRSFEKDKQISVYDGNCIMIGCVIVKANGTTHTINQNITVIHVKTSIDDDEPIGTLDASSNDELTMLSKVMHQCLIKPYIVNFSKTLNLDKDEEFISKFVTTDETLLYYKKELYSYLKNKIQREFSININQNIVFIFNIKIPVKEGYVVGRAEAIGTPCCIVYQKRNSSTMVHEVLHGLFLQHTHIDSSVIDADQRYVYKKEDENNISTYNIMSYAGCKYNLWEWQVGVLYKHKKNTK